MAIESYAPPGDERFPYCEMQLNTNVAHFGRHGVILAGFGCIAQYRNLINRGEAKKGLNRAPFGIL